MMPERLLCVAQWALVGSDKMDHGWRSYREREAADDGVRHARQPPPRPASGGFESLNYDEAENLTIRARYQMGTTEGVAMQKAGPVVLGVYNRVGKTFKQTAKVPWPTQGALPRLKCCRRLRKQDLLTMARGNHWREHEQPKVPCDRRRCSDRRWHCAARPCGDAQPVQESRRHGARSLWRGRTPRDAPEPA